MNDGRVCRTAPATPGLLKILRIPDKENLFISLKSLWLMKVADKKKQTGRSLDCVGPSLLILNHFSEYEIITNSSL